VKLHSHIVVALQQYAGGVLNRRQLDNIKVDLSEAQQSAEVFTDPEQLIKTLPLAKKEEPVDIHDFLNAPDLEPEGELSKPTACNIVDIEEDNDFGKAVPAAETTTEPAEPVEEAATKPAERKPGKRQRK
jgi:hypothetical protein